MDKVRKLILPITEFIASPNVIDYDINGVDEEKAIFFYRVAQQQFAELQRGDYTLVNESNNQILRITNAELLSTIEKFQVCYVFDFSSSDYKPEFGTDVNVLKDRYNELYEDVKMLFKYVKETMMVADGEDVTTILPQLDVNEVWVKTETGYRGFGIADLEANIQEQIKKFESIVQEIFKQIEEKKQEIIKEMQGVAQENLEIIQGKIDGFGDVVNEAVDRIDQSIIEVDGRFDLIWRMYSVIIGSNRYLSGNNLSLRKEENLERVVESGRLKDREGDPRKVYDGGRIGDRGIMHPTPSYRGGE